MLFRSDRPCVTLPLFRHGRTGMLLIKIDDHVTSETRPLCFKSSYDEIVGNDSVEGAALMAKTEDEDTSSRRPRSTTPGGTRVEPKKMPVPPPPPRQTFQVNLISCGIENFELGDEALPPRQGGRKHGKQDDDVLYHIEHKFKGASWYFKLRRQQEASR